MEATPTDANGAAAPLMNGTTPHADAPAPSTSSPTASAAPAGEQCLSEMNAAFAKCLSLVCPPIQYPPHCRFNPVQQDAADMTEIEARLEEFFLHAKQIELLFLRDGATSNGREARHELELEILHLENELNEKNDLIEKYADVVRGWEGKFKRLGHRMAHERD